MITVSPDIYLLYYIYQNYGVEFVAYSQLVKDLDGVMSSKQILLSATLLGEWSCLKRSWGEVDDNRVGSGWRIDEKYGIVYKLKSEPLNLDEVMIVDGEK